MSRRLITTSSPKHPVAAVLVLHGGAARRAEMQVSPTQLSVLRMIPIARGLARAGQGKVAVYRLLNSVRGWDTHHTPVEDVRWALSEVRHLLPSQTPIALVGHSLGGRAALLSVTECDVRCVVALAPWVYPDDGSADATGRDVLIVHGTDDRIADPKRSEAAARRLRRTARYVAYIRVVGGKHAMLRRHRTFSRLMIDFTMTTLLDRRPSRAADIWERARTGSPVDA
ncbi:alpha/beta hydrolase [uncultured Jatrophihabitans sp.]|uniref:alpha/beta hydrolase n=1 Tax=uncultured Jatrophihabitans sp. TaxID=1610747 RepID=UPI0035CA7CD6